MYDLVINGVNYTQERAEKYDFSDPYAYMYTVLVVRSDNDDIFSLEGLDGKTTANSAGSTYRQLGEKYGAIVKAVESLDETMEMVISGKADATINAEVSVGEYLRVHPDAEIKTVDTIDNASKVAIPILKSSQTTSLRKAVNRALDAMREDGSFSQISIKYLGVDITNP